MDNTENMQNWLKVILVRGANKPEAMPVEFVEDKGDYCLGILKLEPAQDFGCHMGDEIRFFPYTSKGGDTVLICDMNLNKKFTREEFAGGKLLKKAITTFNAERTRLNLLEVLQLLRDSEVWISCTTATDQNGGEITVPVLLENGDKSFFPVFSSADEMGEFGDKFPKVEKHLLEALKLAGTCEKTVAGAVVDPFTEPFFMDKEVWRIVENLKSRME